jgi:hypothetical protein
MKRRIFSVLLALCMLLTLVPLVPLTAFASEPIVISTQADWDNVRDNGSITIPTTGGRIILKTNVTGTLWLYCSTKDLTIDGEGHRIDGIILLQGSTDLTLKDLEIHDTGYMSNAAVYFRDGGGSLTTLGTVKIYGGSGSGNNGCGIWNRDALTITASDDTVVVGGNNSKRGQAVYAGMELKLNGGSPTFQAGNNCPADKQNHGVETSYLTINSLSAEHDPTARACTA